jgi:hypothetical protein
MEIVPTCTSVAKMQSSYFAYYVGGLAVQRLDSIVNPSVHYQACKNSAGNGCFDSDLSGNLIVEAIVKLLLSIVNYSARYAGNCSLTQRGRSAAYIRPKLGQTTLGLVQKEMTFVYA